MGQEASTPMDGRGVDGIEASLEEQAKAPPSSVNPTASFTLPKDGSKRNKLNLPNMFQRTTKDHHLHHNHHDLESFEQREVARAAATGGNLYQDNDDFSLQKMPSQQQSDEFPSGNTYYPQESREDEIINPEGAWHLSTTAENSHTANASSSGVMRAQQHSVSIQTPEFTASQIMHSQPAAGTPDRIKKGLFPGRSARGMINSMRNLSIGGALRKQKEIQDWEKQWDEDEDDSDDDQQQQQQQLGGGGGMTLRPGMDAGHSSSSGLAVPPPPPAVSSAVCPQTPPRGTPLQQQHLRYPSAPVSPLPPAKDLFSAPPSPQADRAAGFEWDIVGVPVPSLDGRQPDVKMFLPVLRVLGKGSFGKVGVMLLDVRKLPGLRSRLYSRVILVRYFRSF